MKQHLIFVIIASICVGGIALFEYHNPEPPAEYRIFYFGSPSCGACKAWKANELPAWRRDPVSRTTRLELASLNGDPWKGGYGSYQKVFWESHEGRHSVTWPSFALYENGEFERLYTGIRGWNSLEKRVRREAERTERLYTRIERGELPAF